MEDSPAPFQPIIEATLREDRSPRARVRRLAAAILDDPSRRHP